jgi:hypothetical protein
VPAARAAPADPDRAPLWTTILAIAGLACLAFVAGAAIMHFGLFPKDPLRRAFSAGAALYEGATAYDDRFMTDFWADARTGKRGVTIHDPARAENGLTLYSSTHEQLAYLMDMEGRIVHRWQMNFSRLWDESAAVRNPRPDEFIYIEKARVLPNGDLVALYTAIGDTPWGYGIARLNAGSEVVWKYLAHAHHDFDIDAAGNIHVLTQQVTETELQGFAHLPGPRIDDHLVTLSPDGREIASTPLMEVFAKSPYGRRLYFASQDSVNTGDYLHANSVDVLEGPAPGISGSRAGQVLLSFREINTIALVDTERAEIVWAQSGPWVRQHDAQLLPSGNLLLFDNEGDANGHSRSRVIELEPASSGIVWSYTGTAAAPLESLSRSSQSRLANGNTLIVESMAGRVIEVAPDGDIVWEFVNPVRGGEGDRRIPIIFWVQRLDPERDLDERFRAELARQGGSGGLRKRPGAISHDTRAAARGVAGIAQIKPPRREPRGARRQEQPRDRTAPAGVVGAEAGPVSAFDRRGGVRVAPARRVAAEIVRQVGADDDEGLRPAPQPLQNERDLLRRGAAHQQRRQREPTEHRLQERQLHLQGMLGRVGSVVPPHEGEVGDRGEGGLVHRNRAQRRLERRRRWNRDARHPGVMRGPDQDNPRDRPEAPAQRGEGGGGDRPGIDIAGMGRDQRLGRCPRLRRRLRQQRRHLRREPAGFGGIEGTGDRRRTDTAGHRIHRA